MAIQEHTLQNRKDTVSLLLDLIRPLRKHYSSLGSTLHIGSTAAHYGEKSARMEGWARVLWGLGPLFAGDNHTLPAAMQEEIADWQALYLEGLIHGTDPVSPGYWGDIYDYDQKMVEVAAIAVALSLAPQALWDPLTSLQQHNVIVWLGQMNDHSIHPNNWRFFRILTNMLLRRLGYPANTRREQEDFQVIEHCYKGNGWYYDGNDGQLDYYIPFAMHFYSLLWSALIPAADPRTAEYAAQLQQRSSVFAHDFAQWFADDGAEVPFGRSLTYRFAHAAFFSALAFAGVKALPWGAVRHLVLQNLRHWISLPIFDNTGILTIGYQYPNLLMSEKYNAPGSPYWAFKTFLILALPEDHPFWQAQEECLPHPEQCIQREPRMLVCHEGNNVLLYPAGQHCMEHGNCAAKYEKFVYSNRFGFSVSRGNTLEMGAFDDTLAASPKGWNDYHMRYGVLGCRVCADYTWTRYSIFPGTQFQSWIIPCGHGWHVRIHYIRTSMALDLADGGYAIPAERPFAYPEGAVDSKWIPGHENIGPHHAAALLPWGASAIATECQDAVPRMIRTAPNTNLMAPLTAVPTVELQILPGEHLLIDSVFGYVGSNAQKYYAMRPLIVTAQQQVKVLTTDQKEIRISVEE